MPVDRFEKAKASFENFCANVGKATARAFWQKRQPRGIEVEYLFEHAAEIREEVVVASVAIYEKHLALVREEKFVVEQYFADVYGTVNPYTMDEDVALGCITMYFGIKECRWVLPHESKINRQINENPKKLSLLILAKGGSLFLKEKFNPVSPLSYLLLVGLFMWEAKRRILGLGLASLWSDDCFLHSWEPKEGVLYLDGNCHRDHCEPNDHSRGIYLV
jgi:hypothetical protein